MKKFLIQKIVDAETLEDALTIETTARIFNIQEVVPEEKQLKDAIGFDSSVPYDED